MPQEKTVIPTQAVTTQTNETITAPIQNVASEQITGMSSANDLSFMNLFMQADFVVQGVMLLLIVASIACWTIIFQKFALISSSRKKMASFLNLFWEGRGGKTMEEFYYEMKDKNENPMSRIFVAGMFECYEKKGKRRPMKRAERALMNASMRELNFIEKNIPFLATVGSAGPFLGLFGTVWGIMNAFQNIAVTQNTSLAVVAPGIAEALFATAIGLFAAIPAVIFYNKFNGEISKVSHDIDDFIDELVIYIDREFE